MMKRVNCVPKPVMQGGKVLYFTVPKDKVFARTSGLCFVDSLNFLKMPLSAFTKTFGLKTKKGFYPHFFNTPQNANYVGAMPDKSFFGPDTMTRATFQDFTVWYDQQEHRVWDNRAELISYCHADTRLLREGCLRFRSLVMAATRKKDAKTKKQICHDPLQETTLASSAMRVFRSLHLQKDTIAAMPASLVRRLRPAFCGGRTDCAKLHFKAGPDQRIRYADFTSLYPFINKYGVYPKGHCTTHTSTPWPSMTEGLSLWEVDVECPQDLYHPLLHSKGELLMFDLRKKTKLIYTNLELNAAIVLGYRVTHIYEAWHWASTITGLFANYINCFLKLKQEAANWPKENMCPEEKTQYVQEYFDKEGIVLDPAKIQANAGLYATAKLYLNTVSLFLFVSAVLLLFLSVCRSGESSRSDCLKSSKTTWCCATPLTATSASTRSKTRTRSRTLSSSTKTRCWSRSNRPEPRTPRPSLTPTSPWPSSPLHRRV